MKLVVDPGSCTRASALVHVGGMNVEDRKQACREVVEANRSAGEAFFLTDLGDVYRKHKTWKAVLPRVEPFYAIKCNSDPVILKALVALNLGFDCASAREIQTMLDLGVCPSRIIYANPCKPLSHLRFARKVGVRLMTFDNETELRKCAEHFPSAELVLRVLADDSKAVCRLGLKYGARPACTLRLLQLAKALGLNVVGVSFHVGSGSTDPAAFSDAVYRARAVFDQARRTGFNPTLLDVGGGFPGSTHTPSISFDTIATRLTSAIDECFPPASGVRVIAEPGRFYVASACCLAVNVIAKRLSHEVSDEDAAAAERSRDADGTTCEDQLTAVDALTPAAPHDPNKEVSNDYEHALDRVYRRERTLSLGLSRHGRPPVQDARQEPIRFSPDTPPSPASPTTSSPSSPLTASVSPARSAFCEPSSTGGTRSATPTSPQPLRQDDDAHVHLGKEMSTHSSPTPSLAKVSAQRVGEGSFMYYVNDGCYSSFNCILFDHAVVQGEVLLTRTETRGRPLYPCSVWGPTCDSMDCIEKRALLPELEVGDWLFYNDMGAYTSCAASTFNGFEQPLHFYTFSADASFDAQAALPAGFPVCPLTGDAPAAGTEAACRSASQDAARVHSDDSHAGEESADEPPDMEACSARRRRRGSFPMRAGEEEDDDLGCCCEPPVVCTVPHSSAVS